MTNIIIQLKSNLLFMFLIICWQKSPCCLHISFYLQTVRPLIMFTSQKHFHNLFSLNAAKYWLFYCIIILSRLLQYFRVLYILSQKKLWNCFYELNMINISQFVDRNRCEANRVIFASQLEIFKSLELKKLKM